MRRLIERKRQTGVNISYLCDVVEHGDDDDADNDGDVNDFESDLIGCIYLRTQISKTGILKMMRLNQLRFNLFIVKISNAYCAISGVSDLNERTFFLHMTLDFCHLNHAGMVFGTYE